MKLKAVRSLVFMAAMLVPLASFKAAEPASDEAKLASKLVTALEKDDYPSFVADGEAPFKQLTKEQFAGVAAQLASRLNAGYEIAYLGDLRKGGYHVTLWKIHFKNGGDDLLATLSVKDGKVGGFYLV